MTPYTFILSMNEMWNFYYFCSDDYLVSCCGGLFASELYQKLREFIVIDDSSTTYIHI